MTRKLSSPENKKSTSLIVDEIFLSDCLSEKQIKNNIRFNRAAFVHYTSNWKNSKIVMNPKPAKFHQRSF